MNKNQGFTLIELLVVVLIIGILSAVALPQYQWAVEKARATEALVMLKTLRDAENIYYLANGVYTGNIEDLDVDVPESRYFRYSVNNSMSVVAFHKTHPYLLAYRYPTVEHESIVCGTDSSGEADVTFAKKICGLLGADTSIDDNRWPIVN